MSPKNISSFLNVSRLFLRRLHLHEYQCKDLLKNYGINTQRYMLVENKLTDADSIKNLAGVKNFVVKAQILAGGRGKGVFRDGFRGGVHLCDKVDEALSITNSMLFNTLITKQTNKDGIVVNKVMIAESLGIKSEKYLAIVLDTSSSYNGGGGGGGGIVLMGSPMGGMDIEEVSVKYPDSILKIPLDVDDKNIKNKAVQMAKFLNFDQSCIDQCSDQIERLYKLFNEIDATQIEINPFAVASCSGQVVCFDCKINVDDNAEYRHPDLFEMEDRSQLNKLEVRAKSKGLNYVLMDGNIACIVNGAGLAMATMDLLHCYGAKAANFLDLGGRITVDGVIEALDIVVSDNKVDRIFINIFGGIVNCAVVAEGIIKFYSSNCNTPLKMVVRIEGNQADVAKQLLSTSKFAANITIADNLSDAAEKICY